MQDIALRMHLTDGESLQLTLNNGYYIRVRSMDDDCEERTVEIKNNRMRQDE